jgi:hypothetical protein
MKYIKDSRTNKNAARRRHFMDRWNGAKPQTASFLSSIGDNAFVAGATDDHCVISQFSGAHPYPIRAGHPWPSVREKSR